MEINAYAQVQQEIDAARGAKDPEVAAAAIRRAQLALARVATEPNFDMRRHRAIATALRELAHTGRRESRVTPPVKRGAR
jgi:hypothetical protein